MAIEFIRPKDLPAAAGVNPTDDLIVDNGASVGRATPREIVDAARPVATEPQAVAGTDNDVAMTPLTTAQAIAADGAGIKSDAQAALQGAQTAQGLAEGARDSAQGYASAAGGSASDAAGSASGAASSASAALASAGNAASSESTASQAASTAITAQGLAEDWAESPTPPDGPGTKSSKTWAGEAEAEADRTAINAGAVVARAYFKEVSALISDNNVVIGYTGSGADFTVQAGDVFEAGGFRYEVATEGASDEHIITAGGVKLYTKPVMGAYDPKQFGAVGDFYLPDGVTENPSPTDDTSAIQKCISVMRGNGGMLLSAHHYTTETIQTIGITSIKSSQVVASREKASQGVERPYGITNRLTDMFNSNPSSKQSGFHFEGITLIGAPSTTTFTTTGKTYEVDYFNVVVRGCIFYSFGVALDGRLGTWVWSIYNNRFGRGPESSHDIAIWLNQPHAAIIEGNSFSSFNRVDIYSFAEQNTSGASGGVATHIIDNMFDFRQYRKEACLEVNGLQSWTIEGNYLEEYGANIGESLVNNGVGTIPFLFTIDHFTPEHVPTLRNNFVVASNLQRVIVLKRIATSENFSTRTPLQIYGNTFAGTPNSLLYHDQDPSKTGRLLMPKPLLKPGGVVSDLVGDPNGTLWFSGNGARFQAKASYSSPQANTKIDFSDPAFATILQDDKCLYIHTNQEIRMTMASGYRVTLLWRWSSATPADFVIRVSDSTGVPNLGTYEFKEIGESGVGSVTIPVEAGNTAYLTLQVREGGGTTTLCDEIDFNLLVESLSL